MANKVQFKPIKVEDVYTSSGRYGERAKSAELTDELKANAADLVSRVNGLLQDLGVAGGDVTSGFRPSDVNAKVKNAAKKSLHQSCKAVDLADTGTLKGKIISAPHLLSKWGLWLEDSASTPTWCHLDTGVRSERLIRTFKP